MKMKTLLVMLIACGIFSSAKAQYAADVLRFSQLHSIPGARTQSMGNTVVGLADDYSALFGNPAGLSQQKSYDFSIGLSRQGYGNDVSFFGNKVSDNANSIRLDNLAVVYPVATRRGGLTFGLGYGRTANFTSVASFDGFNPASSIIRSFSPYGGSLYNEFKLSSLLKVEADDLLKNHLPFNLFLADTANGYLFPVLTDSVQQSGRIVEGGGINHWSFGGGIDIAEDLSVGVSLNFVSGSYTYDQEYTESDTRNVYKSSYAFPYNFDYWTYKTTVQSDIRGFNVLIGMMYRKQGKFRIGASVRLPSTYAIEKTFTEDGESNFDDKGPSLSFISDGKSKYEITTPLIFSTGFSAQPVQWLLLAGEAEYTDWTEMQFVTDNSYLKQENRYIQRSMRETWNLRAGGEITLQSVGVVLRGGLEWKPSPWKDDPKGYDQWNYSAGIGILINETSTVHLSYALRYWQSFRDNYFWGSTPASRTSESITTQTIGITFSHHF